VKTKHPQLHYESKVYMLLQGGSEFSLFITQLISLDVYVSIGLSSLGFLLTSGCSAYQMVRC